MPSFDTQHPLKLRIITDRIRSMGEGYIFTHVCHSVHNLGCLVFGGWVSGLNGRWVSGLGGGGVRPHSLRLLLLRSVCILLECILVLLEHSLSKETFFNIPYISEGRMNICTIQIHFS